MLGLANQQAEIYAPATEFEAIRFRSLPSREIVWHLNTQGNDVLLAAYINVFDPRRGKRRCFIPFLVYALVYPSISSNLITLATLSPWSDPVYMQTCSPLFSNPIFRRYKTVKTGLLINWNLEL